MHVNLALSPPLPDRICTPWMFSRYLYSTISAATTYLSTTPASGQITRCRAANASCSSSSSSSSSSTASFASVSSRSFSQPCEHELDEGLYDVIDSVLDSEDLYDVLGISRTQAAAQPASLRRAYLSRSRRCHPDKFPANDRATQAFQRVALAYTVLDNPSTRKTYDANPVGATALFTSQAPVPADATFDGVLQVIFADFMAGDFEMIRTFLSAVKDINPHLNLTDETIDSIITTLRRLRDAVQSCQTYTRVVRVEILHLYDIQVSLRELPYLALAPRLRLTLKFVRVLLSLPIAIDRAIEDTHELPSAPSLDAQESQVVQRKSQILGSKMTGILSILLLVLEKSENILG